MSRGRCSEEFGKYDSAVPYAYGAPGAQDRQDRSLFFLLWDDGSSSIDKGSLIKQIFGGCRRSQLRCCNCGYCSNTFEPIFDLTLEIGNVDSILDALVSFTKFEKIDDPQVKFTCEGCKNQVQIEKQLKLDQALDVLVLHLKRFKNNGATSYKISNLVEHPLELDLTSCLTSKAYQVSLKYDLYAVLVHVGLSNFGHYFVAFVPLQVTRVSESCALGRGEYVHFYAEKGSSCWFSNFMEEQKTLNFECAIDTSSSVLGYAKIDASINARKQYNMQTPSPSFYQNSCTMILPCLLIQSTSRSREMGRGSCLKSTFITIDETSHFCPQSRYEFENEKLDDDKKNHLVPQLDVKLNAMSKAKKIALEPSKDAQVNEAFDILVGGMPSSGRSDILACIASHQTNLEKSQPISFQSSGSKRRKICTSVYSNPEQQSQSSLH